MATALKSKQILQPELHLPIVDDRRADASEIGAPEGTARLGTRHLLSSHHVRPCVGLHAGIMRIATLRDGNRQPGAELHNAVHRPSAQNPALRTVRVAQPGDLPDVREHETEALIDLRPAVIAETVARVLRVVGTEWPAFVDAVPDRHRLLKVEGS